MICLYKETILVSGYLTWQDEGPKTTSPIEAENANGIDLWQPDSKLSRGG